MEICVRRSPLMLALLPALMLASMPARAEPVGNLRSVSASAGRDGVQGWDLQTDKGARIRIELPATDIIRVQAGRNGTLTGAGDKAAPIDRGTGRTTGNALRAGQRRRQRGRSVAAQWPHR